VHRRARWGIAGRGAAPAFANMGALVEHTIPKDTSSTSSKRLSCDRAYLVALLRIQTLAHEQVLVLLTLCLGCLLCTGFSVFVFHCAHEAMMAWPCQHSGADCFYLVHTAIYSHQI